MKIAFVGSVFAAFVFLAPQVEAQTCTSTLGASWAAPTLSISLSGAPINAPTMTFVGLNQGSTTTMHGLTLGLTMPFYGMFFGVTDGNGDLVASRTLSNVPTGVTAYLQSVSMDMSNHSPGNGMGGGGMGGGGMGGGGGGSGPMGMTFCVSNVASVVF